MFDLVIRGGRIVDGTGSATFGGDIGVTGDRITAIGDLSAAEARTALDATGLVVAPGFIDIHSHSDFTLLIDPRAHSQIHQGVTTELVGNCGHGCAPLGANIEAFTGNIYGYQDLIPIDWTTMEGYLARMEEAGPAVNVATLVPNGNLRLAVVDDLTRPATGGETAQMAGLLEAGARRGGIRVLHRAGVSRRAGSLGGRTHRAVPGCGPPRWAVRDPRAEPGTAGDRGGGRGPAGGGRYRSPAAAVAYHSPPGRAGGFAGALYRTRGGFPRGRIGCGVRRAHAAARNHQPECGASLLGRGRRTGPAEAASDRSGHQGPPQAVRQHHLLVRFGRLGPRRAVLQRRIPEQGG